MEELRCNEVLELQPPSPSTARISSTPSPDVHYGIYMKSKPWLVDAAAISNTANGKENAAATTQESVLPSTTMLTSNREELPVDMKDSKTVLETTTSTAAISIGGDKVETEVVPV